MAEAIKAHLLPLATIVTPNIPEASKLLGRILALLPVASPGLVSFAPGLVSFACLTNIPETSKLLGGAPLALLLLGLIALLLPRHRMHPSWWQPCHVSRSNIPYRPPRTVTPPRNVCMHNENIRRMQITPPPLPQQMAAPS